MKRIPFAFPICALLSINDAYALQENDAIAKAKEALGLRAGQHDIAVVRVSKAEWRNSSLGCPRPGMMYAQVITPGYQVILSVDGKEYDYRVSDHATLLCEKSGAKANRGEHEQHSSPTRDR